MAGLTVCCGAGVGTSRASPLVSLLLGGGTPLGSSTRQAHVGARNLTYPCRAARERCRRIDAIRENLVEPGAAGR